MCNLFLNFYKYFIVKQFELAHLGELSTYTYDDLSVELRKFKKQVKFKGNAMIVAWESVNTILVIKYNYDGDFIEKVSEKWK